MRWRERSEENKERNEGKILSIPLTYLVPQKPAFIAISIRKKEFGEIDSLSSNSGELGAI